MKYRKQKILEAKAEIRWITSRIEYEEAGGFAHTYHDCPHCGKNKTRAGRCAACLKKDLAELVREYNRMKGE